LLIDKAHYFNVAVDDIDAYQSDIGLMEMWSKDASEQMRNYIDRGILSDIYTDADADNTGATAGRISGAYDLGITGFPAVVTADNILDYIVDMGTVLDEADIPSENRWLVAPAWFTGMIKKSDLQDASMTGDKITPLRNGKIGVIDRFTIYMSNNVHNAIDAGAAGTPRCFDIMAGHISSTTFANQIVKVQNVMSERTFANLVRGLNVYGYKVVVPEAMTVLYAAKG